MNRRNFLGTLTALSLSSVLNRSHAERALAQDAALKQNAKKGNFPENATIVLVHAAWADGSCWDNVILPLERQGLSVVCAPIPLTSLTNDVIALQRTLDRTDGGPSILVGHAYSGAVIAAVSETYPVKALVYITALAPDEGETVAKVFYHNPPGPHAPKMVPDANGLVWMPKDAFSQALNAKASADQSRIAAALQRPLSVQCIQEAAPKPLWKSKPSWFLIAEDDRMIDPKTQRFMANRMGATIRPHSVDHTPMVSEPEPVVDIILEAARKTLSV